MKAYNRSSEEIARTVHGMRREIGAAWKNRTPEGLRDEIYGRNLRDYGDELGPSIDFLRNEQGKSWEQIIESASRPGGKNIKFSFFTW